MEPAVPPPSSNTGSRSTIIRKSQDLAFINISNPSESASHENRRFVRQFVKLTKRAKTEPHAHLKDELPLPSSQQAIPPTELEGGAWPFIGISHPSQMSSPQSLRFVRQQAQRKHRRVRLSKKVADDEDEKKKKLAKESEEEAVEEVLHSQTIDLAPVRWNSPPRHAVSLLDIHVGMANFVFPIKMNSAAYEIVDYLHGDYESVMIRPTARREWFGTYLQDHVAFQELIGISLYARSRYMGGSNQYDKQINAYHANSIRSVKQRLSDPVQRTSSGLMLAILSLVAHDTLTLNAQGFKINMAGLARIVELRGGLDSLDDISEVRFVILWVDVKSAYTFDVPPTFVLSPAKMRAQAPIPHSQPPSKLLLNIFWKWTSHYPQRNDILSAFQDLYTLNSSIKTSFWELQANYTLMGLQSSSLVRRFMTPLVNGQAGMSGGLVEKALRLASLMYIDRLREAFSEVLPMLGYQFVMRLLIVVSTDSPEWDGFQEVRLWAAVVGGSIAARPAETKGYVDITRRILSIMGIREWCLAREILEDLLWIDGIFRVRCEDFGRLVLGG